MNALRSSSFIDALHSDRASPDRADKMGLYGQFIGRWDMDGVLRAADGTRHTARGEIHFGWVLGGRAIQDVWIMPGRDAPPSDWPADFYGTTLRVYDPGIDAWHILWIDPVKQLYRRMVGRARGPDIVQDGTDEGGAPVRWSFTEITPDSFHWLAERSPDGGTSWQLVVEFFARRVAA
jgi:hypothetical protein